MNKIETNKRYIFQCKSYVTDMNISVFSGGDGPVLLLYDNVVGEYIRISVDEYIKFHIVDIIEVNSDYIPRTTPCKKYAAIGYIIV